ncbi:hypothetical protein MNB_SV-12-822 [hydrothermal vent metagenome]|uniref:Double Cache domain-containing protein n=1 Tax=hydrothermal vent metagenome TaxID=652676 RepID=A0A1W1CEN2_9ZZZZ
MKHISKLYLTIIFSILFLLSISIIFFAKNSQRDKHQELSSYLIRDFQKALDFENADLLSFSLALSEDGALKNALTSNNEQKAFEILSSITKRFRKYTHIKTLRLQVLDRDFFIFAQSWGQGSVGMPMWWFRDDLEKLKHNKEPKVGMETGRMLTFKATIPLRSGKECIGYLEVIKFVDEFAQKLHQSGIELFALMETKYLKQASLMRDFPFLNRYIIVNQNFNKKLKKHASFIDWKELNSLGYFYKEGMLFVLEPMYNGEREEIGKYLIVLPKETVNRYEKSYQDISLVTRLSDSDLYRVVKSWKEESSMHKIEQNSIDSWKIGEIQ